VASIKDFDDVTIHKHTLLASAMTLAVLYLIMGDEMETKPNYQHGDLTEAERGTLQQAIRSSGAESRRIFNRAKLSNRKVSGDNAQSASSNTRP
jgi:hypothetical protein